ncbi:NUDIX hydrolase [Paractinoplanes durhamensis]|uniref:ADP-ribose pyrophosphatase n=1 Tax=Paractinoplanes durhamensis TaxID=113563 RepID=A0ABQ3Z0Z2_9ACTN|nr:NUDIX hydrolase [Actinoplanes durhamensis]GIE03459.1 ADP-ribose pyrophosphatase [Actinoplanes durhamensis]
MDEKTRRSAYDDLRESFPHLFANPPDAAFAILTDPAEIAEAELVRTADLAEAGLPAYMAETGVVFMDSFMMVLRDAVKTRDGAYGTYGRVVAPGNSSGVVVLPLVAGKIVLVNHFRHSTRSWHLELPRGFGTPGIDDPADDARRELREEIGTDAATIHDLGIMYPDTGATSTPVRLFFAEVTGAPFAADRAEGIDDIRIVDPVELARLIGNASITDGFTIAAYTRAVLRGLLPGRS